MSSKAGADPSTERGSRAPRGGGGADLALLRDRLEAAGSRLGDAAIWYIGHRVAAALAHAHSVTDDEGNPAPAVHLGLRPEDVQIAWDGRVRLVNRPRLRGDALAEDAGGADGAALVYMAPEQRSGGRVTHRADVYRLGLLLWSLLAWRRPPADGSRPERLSVLREDLPAALADVIDATLEPSAGKRTVTCTEIEEWLATMVDARAGERELRERVAGLREPDPAPSPVVEPPASPEPPPSPLAEPPASVEPHPSSLVEPPASPDPAPSPVVEPPASPEPPPSPVAELHASPDPAPSPLALPEPIPSRPLSPVGFVMVALLTAVIIVVIGSAVGDRMLRISPNDKAQNGAYSWRFW